MDLRPSDETLSMLRSAFSNLYYNSYGSMLASHQHLSSVDGSRAIHLHVPARAVTGKGPVTFRAARVSLPGVKVGGRGPGTRAAAALDLPFIIPSLIQRAGLTSGLSNGRALSLANRGVTLTKRSLLRMERHRLRVARAYAKRAIGYIDLPEYRF